jgi:H+-transporting ATPase
MAAGPMIAEAAKKASLPELFNKLESGNNGLSSSAAQSRLRQYGPNEISEKRINPYLKFLAYFRGPIPWMIEAAVVFSALVRHWPDFFLFLVLLVANAVVGFWEEYQAGNAVAALKATLALQVCVKRDGKWTTLAARELVLGDLVHLRLGGIVPADALLREGDPVDADQSASTGESLPVARESGDAVYSGSIVRRGEIDALVYGTGQNTYFGRTGQLVEQTHTVSHFQRAVLKIGDYLIVLAVGPRETAGANAAVRRVKVA